jgi:hypothetical protein
VRAQIRRRPVFGGLIAVVCAAAAFIQPAPANATANPWPHAAVGGFATASGGFWVAFADGSVGAHGNAFDQGDAAGIQLNAPIVAGAATPRGGYWLAGADGGVFTFGGARYEGGLGGTHLNGAIVGMAATPSGNGYWLAARDGGVFAFGDAGFYGSLGSRKLNSPVVGIAPTTSGRGYRLVAGDGGVFSFGDATFRGSVPGLGAHIGDAIGIAPTPDGSGYWIARSSGTVYAFNAARFGSYTPGACDAVAGIFANPASAGYRLVTRAGATVPFGAPLAGMGISGTQRWCSSQTTCPGTFNRVADYQHALDTTGPLWEGSDGGTIIDLGDGRRIWLFGDTYLGPSGTTNLLPGFRLVHNTIAVQQAGCIEFRTGGAGTFTTSYFAEPAPDEWYWPLDGVVDRHAGLVYVTVMHLRTAPGPAGFGWREVDTRLIALDYHSLVPLFTRPMPRTALLLWGASMTQTGDTIYVYARGGDKPRQYVARTTFGHLLDGAWDYWNGHAWSSQPLVGQLKFRTAIGGPDAGPTPAVTVDQYGSGYLASAKRCDILCPDLTAWYASSPQGPWYAVNANGGALLTTTPRLARQVTYGGHLMQTRAGWIGVWSSNFLGISTLKHACGLLFAAPHDLPTPAQLAAQHPG